VLSELAEEGIDFTVSKPTLKLTTNLVD